VISDWWLVPVEGCLASSIAKAMEDKCEAVSAKRCTNLSL